MEFVVQNQLSDDQWALIACAAAVILCGTIMSLSYFIGQARQAVKTSTLRSLAGDRSIKTAPSAERKAA